MNQLSRIASVTDASAGTLVQPGSFAALGDEIVSARLATPQVHPGRASGRYGRGPGVGRLSGSWRRRLLIGVPLAAGLAVAGLIATSLGSPGQRVGPISVGPPPAQALSFTRHGHYIYVIVRNPVADPKRYRAEFAKYHLDITLRLEPASPSIVGSVVYADGSGIVPITAIGKCFTGGGGNVCPVGVKVPIDFRGAAEIVFARAARPGEQYESAGQANSPGEVMHGLHYEGKTVAAVLAMLARRGASVSSWRVQRAKDCYTEARRTVPANWLVYDAVPWAPGQVLLWAARTLPVPTCATAPGTPVPSPAPSS